MTAQNQQVNKWYFVCPVCGCITEHHELKDGFVCQKCGHVKPDDSKRAYQQREDVKAKKRAYQQRRRQLIKKETS